MKPAAASPLRAFALEVPKLGAFLRRDWLVMLSYRAALVSDWLSLLAQVALFAFISQLVAPERLPRYGDTQPTYLEFVAVGIVVSGILSVGLDRLASVVRGEQTTGTLEQILSTPVRIATYQVGSTLFSLLYVPVRMAIFLALVAAVLGGDFAFRNLAPAAVVIAALVPVVWGLGLAGAGATLTVRRGAGVSGFAGLVLGAASGAYFPVELLPTWLQALMRYNPVTIALEAARAALLGNAGWSAMLQPVASLLIAGIAALAAGSVVFRWGLHRELRKGTLGLY